MNLSLRGYSVRLGCWALLGISAPAHGAFIDDGGCCRHGSPLQLELAIPDTRGPTCDAGTEPLFFQGETCQVVTNQGINEDGFQFADLRITSFEMTTNHPVFGLLVVELDTSRPVTSTLLGTAPGPDASVIHTTRINVIATSSMLPGLVLQNQGPPLEFVSGPTDTWPPAQNTYTLPVPVVFEDRANPGTPILTACPGSVEVEGFGLEPPTIPTVSAAGLAVLAVALAIGTLLLLRRVTSGGRS